MTTVKVILSVTMATLRLEMKMVKLCLQWQPRGIIDNNILGDCGEGFV